MLDAAGQARIRWPGIANEPFVTRLREEMRRHAAEFGASLVESPRAHPVFGAALTTVHPLGGCPMGADAGSGVVDADGRVFDPHGGVHDGLYVADGAVVSAWTYGKSQKVRNLERLPQATLQVEAGRDRYDQLRGVMMECDVEIIREIGAVEKVGAALMRRYAGAPDGEIPDSVRQQAPKRVVLVFRPTRVASWDHRKLGGRY